jgi:hypothetical protein
MGSTFFGGRVPGGASECPAAMPSVGTSLGTLATEICRLLQKFRPLQGIQPLTDCSAVVMSELAAICHVLGKLHIHISHASTV